MCKSRLPRALCGAPDDGPKGPKGKNVTVVEVTTEHKHTLYVPTGGNSGYYLQTHTHWAVLDETGLERKAFRTALLAIYFVAHQIKKAERRALRKQAFAEWLAANRS